MLKKCFIILLSLISIISADVFARKRGGGSAKRAAAIGRSSKRAASTSVRGGRGRRAASKRNNLQQIRMVNINEEIDDEIDDEEDSEETGEAGGFAMRRPARATKKEMCDDSDKFTAAEVKGIINAVRKIMITEFETTYNALANGEEVSDMIKHDDAMNLMIKNLGNVDTSKTQITNLISSIAGDIIEDSREAGKNTGMERNNTVKKSKEEIQILKQRIEEYKNKKR